MAPKRKTAQPAVVKVPRSAVLSGIGKLLQESEDVCDVFLKSGLRTARCLLAAAAGPDADLNNVVEELEKAEIPVQGAFLDLIHGQEANLAGTTTFFSLFDMVQRLKIKPCMECCRQTVQESKLDGASIKLSLLVNHKVAIMKELKALSARGQFTAKVKFACDDDGDAELPCVELTLHRVVLAASCQYIRGLWFGGFSETAKADCAAVRLEGTSKHMLQLMVDVAYGEEVTCASTAELLDLFILMDRWGFHLATSSVLECINGRLTSADAERLLKQPSPPPLALLSHIAAVLSKYPPKTMPWGTATLFLQASSKVETITPQLLKVAREVIGRCLCDQSIEKDGLSQLGPQLLGSALPVEAEGHLLESVLKWASQFPAPMDASDLPIAELSNLSALREAVPKHAHRSLFVDAFSRVLREKVFDEGKHEIIASLLNTVIPQGKLALKPAAIVGGSSDGSDSSNLEEEKEGTEEDKTLLEAVIVAEDSDSNSPARKRRRTHDPEEPSAAAGLIEALRGCFQDETVAGAMVFCSGPGLQALHGAAFISLMSWLGATIDGGELSSVISTWVLGASTDTVFEALRMGWSTGESEIRECILGAARRRYARVEQLYLDVEGGKIEERIVHEVAVAEAAKERAFQAREAELRGQLEAALQELGEEKKRRSQDLAEARLRYVAAADQIFKSFGGDGS